jgi:D-hydroxyproline dehydrogenase subunit alpha
VSDSVAITFEGRSIEARRGESVAAALTAAGERVFRTTRTGAARGIFCGMGVCQDCLVEIDGRPNRRACLETIHGPMVVAREGHRRPCAAPAAAPPPVTIDQVPVERPEVLVVGAGPGGLAAAIAARRAGAAVLVLDERAMPGGQYFKQLAEGGAGDGDAQHRRGAQLIATVRALGVTIRSGVEVWGAFPPLTLAGTSKGSVLRFEPKRLIVATGAYERGVPVPGWSAPAPGIGQTGALMRMLGAAPGLLLQGIGYRAQLLKASVPVLQGRRIAAIEATADGLAAHVGDRRFVVDAVCLGYGFEPSSELLRALGCAHDYDPARGHLSTRRDADGRTSMPGVFAVGDCTGLGGALAALAEGAIVGFAAAADLGHGLMPSLTTELTAVRRRLARQRRFQAALWQFYAGPRPELDLADAGTIVCRCEEVTRGEIDAALAEGPLLAGDVKRRTRAGMGACQGRYCGPLIAAAIAARGGGTVGERSGFAPRPPAKPITIADLARHSG